MALKALPLALLLSTAAWAEPTDKPDFSAIARLVGHCWRAPMGEPGMSDLQCYQWMLGGQFVHNTHVVGKPEPVYSGETIFYVDPDEKSIRYHYYTSDGALSTGKLTPTQDGYIVPETHVGADGQRTELRSQFAILDSHHYRVRTEVLQGKAWGVTGERLYVRTDFRPAPDATTELDGRRHTLVFNRNTESGWRVYRSDTGGTLPADVAGNQWVWGSAGRDLLLLARPDADGGSTGWRAFRVSSDGSAYTQVFGGRLADGFVHRSSDGKSYAAEQMTGRGKRIVMFGEGADKPRWFTPEAAGYEDSDPQFAPDGERLLFRSNRGGSWELYTAKLDGTEVRLLTGDDRNNAIDRHEYGGEGPGRYSPDGRHIVWMRKFPDSNYDIWTMASDGSNERALTDNGAISDAYPSWSPDGTRIAFDSDRDGNNEIYVMDGDGENVVRITETPQTELAPVWVEVAP